MVFCQGCPWRCGYCQNPHLLPPTEHNRAYLETKARRSGHFIELPRARVSEQHDDVELDETSGAADPA